MATRSRIGIETPNGQVKSIYCHWDGYPENNGVLLLEYYKDREKLEKLIALGAISSLDKEVDPTLEHSFNYPQPGVTVAYHRDRGDSPIYARTDTSIDSFIKSDVEEYGYLFTQKGEWLFINGHSSTREAIPLASVV